MKQPINKDYFMLNDEGQIIEIKRHTDLEAYHSPIILKTTEDDSYYLLKVTQDFDAEDPRNFSEHFTEMTCFLRNHRQPDNIRYTNATDYLIALCHEYVKDKTYEEIEEFTWQEAYNALNKSNNYYILLIRYYEHSGITISVDQSSYPYNDRWDSGTYGFIGVSKENLFRECGGEPVRDKDGNIVYKEYKHSEDYATYGAERIPLTEDNWKKVASELLRSEVETYDQWLQDDCYGYELFKAKPIYHCSHCGAVIDDLEEILNNDQYELDGKIHHRCDFCGKDLTIDDNDNCFVTLSHYEVIEEKDSCWGFYGDNLKENGILDAIDLGLFEVIEKNCEKVRG